MENIKNILFINACARPESRTLLLAEKVLERLSGEVTELKLYEEEIAPLDYGVLEKRTGLIASGNTRIRFSDTRGSLPKRMKSSSRRLTGSCPFLQY